MKRFIGNQKRTWLGTLILAAVIGCGSQDGADQETVALDSDLSSEQEELYYSLTEEGEVEVEGAEGSLSDEAMSSLEEVKNKMREYHEEYKAICIDNEAVAAFYALKIQIKEEIEAIKEGDGTPYEKRQAIKDLLTENAEAIKDGQSALRGCLVEKQGKWGDVLAKKRLLALHCLPKPPKKKPFLPHSVGGKKTKPFFFKPKRGNGYSSGDVRGAKIESTINSEVCLAYLKFLEE